MNSEYNLEYKQLIDTESLLKIGRVLEYLNQLNISYKIWYHPPLPTIETAMEYWKIMPGTHCKNLFFRNHKGNKHYMVIFECSQTMNITILEKNLRQGKLTFASAERMKKHLGLQPGSVTPFGLLNDTSDHVKLFIDKELENVSEISFHPNDNRASVLIDNNDFKKYLISVGNAYEYINCLNISEKSLPDISI